MGLSMGLIPQDGPRRSDSGSPRGVDDEPRKTVCMNARNVDGIDGSSRDSHSHIYGGP